MTVGIHTGTGTCNYRQLNHTLQIVLESNSNNAVL